MTETIGLSIKISFFIIFLFLFFRVYYFRRFYWLDEEDSRLLVQNIDTDKWLEGVRARAAVCAFCVFLGELF